jgi:transcription initiation factor TFIIB
MNIHERNTIDSRCNECGSEDIVEDKKQGDILCRSCGLVLSAIVVDMGSEWRNFGDEVGEKDPNRVGAPLHPLIESGSGTAISKGLKGYNSLNERLIKVQNQGNSSQINRFLVSSFNRINYFLDKGMLAKNLKGKIEELFKLYFEYLTVRSDGSRTKSKLSEKETDSIISALIYIVFRNEGVQRTYKEITLITRIPKKIIGSRVRAIERSLWGVKISKNKRKNGPIQHFCKKLNLPLDVSQAAEEITFLIKEKDGVYGRTDSSIAATSIFMALQIYQVSGLPSVKEISIITGVSEATMRSIYRSTFPHRKLILDKLNDYKNTSNLKTIKENCNDLLN